ncbi:NlpC/P60 family protein [Acetivibrio clariflavus]|uniref:NlpC/P60 family protein n=1 Tax=Acetivibrio clariflavus TaxID=288965 RepID=UPI0031F48FA2
MKKFSKRHHILVFTALVVFIFFLFINPINRKSTNLMLITSLILLWIYTLFLSRKSKTVKFVLILFPAILFFFLSLNGPTIDKETIRAEYVRALKKYEGTRYLWGGESSLGIDCSGLVRRGLIDTYIRLGIVNFSPQYIRKGLNLWFNDLSAEALGNGYKNQTILILANQTLNTLDYGEMKEGDIMVTANGIHTMAYIGNHEWIQADPKEGKVIILKAPNENFWYNTPSNILRWTDLE